MDALLLARKNDYLARVTVKDKKTGNPITTAATSTLELFRKDSNKQVGSTFTLVHTTGGIWEVTIPRTLDVEVGQELRMEVTLDGGVGAQFFSAPAVKVIERTD